MSAASSRHAPFAPARPFPAKRCHTRYSCLFVLIRVARRRRSPPPPQPVPLSVRVGMAVDTVGQAGKPKTITGFQTHSAPPRRRPPRAPTGPLKSGWDHASTVRAYTVALATDVSL